MDNIQPSNSLSVIDLSKQALSWLEQNQLPPTPINYAVVYACFHPDNPNLRNELLQLTNKNKTPDSYLLAELHHKYLAQAVENDDQTLSTMHTIIIHLQAECEKNESNVSLYQSKLQTEAVKLQKSADAQTNQIVHSILSATKEVQQAQDQFKNNIQTSNSNIEQLKQKLQAAQQQAQSDPLTQLANRRGMQNFIAKHSSEDHFSALMFDIDNFKQLNDSYGHSVGDLVLKKVAQQIIKYLGDNHLAVRYGGEEFLVLVVNQGRKYVFNYAEEVRGAIENLRLIHGKTRKRLPQVTISVGLSLNTKQQTINEIIEQADTALYQAKNSGKNRVCLAS